MSAMIYLRMDQSVMTEGDLERLDLLRRFAEDAGYEITEVWPVAADFESPKDVMQWANARLDLAEGRFDVIVHWHEKEGVPYTLGRLS